MVKPSHTRLDKFGGSYLTSPSSFQQVMDLIVEEKCQLVVVSALADTTQRLQGLLDMALHRQSFQAPLQILCDWHLALAQNVLEKADDFAEIIQLDQAKLGEILSTIGALGEYDVRIRDTVVAIGEYWACELVARALATQTYVVDAAQVLVVDEPEPNHFTVDWQRSCDYLKRYLKQIGFTQSHAHSSIGVITGFVASNAQGHLTTLGFESSDFSASMFARLFDVQQLFIWSNVDGFYDADPILVPDANVITQLSYEEAATLAYTGAKVLHPQALAPLHDLGYPLRIKNMFHPSAPGSLIAECGDKQPLGICGVSAMADVVILTISGRDASIVVRHCLAQITEQPCIALRVGIEQAICLVFSQAHLDPVDAELEQLKQDHAMDFVWSWEGGCAVLSIVGERMRGQPGVASAVSTCLAKGGISLKAICQGSRENHLAVVVPQEMVVKSMRVVHAGLGLSKQRVHLALIGPGNVGAVLLEQLFDACFSHEHVVFKLVAVCRSQRMVLNEEGFGCLDALNEAMNTTAQPSNLSLLAQYLHQHNQYHSVVIDCTSSEDVVDAYTALIHAGCHIVTPNKRAVAGDWHRYRLIMGVSQQAGVRFHYETNVCAGLPIITTLDDLLVSGDQVEGIEGVFSGSLGFICDRLAQGLAFSEVVKQAHQAGLTEPDPRDDLLGEDVARKCVCLARQMGHALSLSDVQLVGLIPDDWRELSIEAFWQALPSQDHHYKALLSDCQKDGKRLVYLGNIDSSGIKVSLLAVAASSPFHSLQGTDNMVVFKTKRYQQNPLVIRGPGAGAAVTAAGVYADLVRLVSSLGIDHATD